MIMNAEECYFVNNWKILMYLRVGLIKHCVCHGVSGKTIYTVMAELHGLIARFSTHLLATFVAEILSNFLRVKLRMQYIKMIS